ncbi:hypothetical protein OFO07_05640 [Campylobacter sp. JMF_06 NA1]|uniref:hypothetical protein n=1 Tax=Campylobacter sp. JMF_06 NA1 TaxID=2983823 RepID=UPI0022E9CA83|nr:hypothetical protein [Campylobacter sp. JMF_06 NA1]MDA3078402.1 hypothetical protein [Campylobacter sp. JMF_06 NA1]
MKNPIKTLLYKIKKPLPPGARKISGIISDVRACEVRENFFVVIFHVGGLRFSSIFAKWWAKNGDLIDVIYTRGWQEGTYSALSVTSYSTTAYWGNWNLIKRFCGVVFSLLFVAFMSAVIVSGVEEIARIEYFYNKLVYFLFFCIVAIVYGMGVVNAYVKFKVFFSFIYYKRKSDKFLKALNLRFPLK